MTSTPRAISRILYLSTLLALGHVALGSGGLHPAAAQDVHDIYGDVSPHPVFDSDTGEQLKGTDGTPVLERYTRLDMSGLRRKNWLTGAQDVQLFADFECTVPHTSPGFLKEYFSVWQSKGIVLLAESEKKKLDPDDEESGHATAIAGYARKKDLVQSKDAEVAYYCLKTPAHVNRKALIVHKWEDSNAVEQASLTDTPDVKGKEITTINLYEILYIYKATEPDADGEKFFLVGRRPYFIAELGKAGDTIHGWVSSKRVFAWNHREAVQLNKNPEAVEWRTKNNKPIRLYGSVTDAAEQGKPMYEEDLTKGPWHHQMQRYPVITPASERNKLIWKVGVIGDSYSGKKVISASLESQIQGKLEELKMSTKKVDVLLVIDASGSMGQFYASIGDTIDAIQGAIQNPAITDIRYAVSYYRDYTEEANPNSWSTTYRDFLPPSQFRKLFERNDPEFVESAGGEDNPCVFMGIDKGLNSVNWRADTLRSVILIGDMGNIEEITRQEGGKAVDARMRKVDAKGYTLMSVVETIKEFDVRLFFAIQASPQGRTVRPRIRQFDYQALAIHRELKSPVQTVLEADGVDLSAALKQSFATSNTTVGVLEQAYQMIKEGHPLTDAIGEALAIHGISMSGNVKASHTGGDWGLFIKDLVIEKAKVKGIDTDALLQKRVQQFAFAYGEKQVQGNPFPQFQEMVLMQVGELETLLGSLRIIERQAMTADNVDTLWKGIVNGLIGEHESSFTYDDDKPLSQYFTKSLGLPARSKYLDMSIRELKTLEALEMTEWEAEIKDKIQMLSNWVMDKTRDGKRADRHIFYSNGIQFVWVPMELFP